MTFQVCNEHSLCHLFSKCVLLLITKGKVPEVDSGGYRDLSSWTREDGEHIYEGVDTEGRSK